MFIATFVHNNSYLGIAQSPSAGEWINYPYNQNSAIKKEQTTDRLNKMDESLKYCMRRR